MFYLFILESIGTSELLMIGAVALIVFGPRKLPEMMRTVGKAVAEFRRSTDDFKSTWEKEVKFEMSEFKDENDANLLMGNQPKPKNTIERNFNPEANQISVPEIREISRDDFPTNIPEVKTPLSEQAAPEISANDKQNWL